LKLNEKQLCLFKIAKRHGCFNLQKIDLERSKVVYHSDSGMVTFHIDGDIQGMILSFDRFVMENPEDYGSFLYSLSQETINYLDKSKHKNPIELFHHFLFSEDGKPRSFDLVIDERVDALFNHFNP
jgi:hypothetical protein